MHRLALVVVLVAGCKGEPKHELPAVKLGSDDDQAAQRAAQLDAIQRKMTEQFKPPARPSTADQIAKLEATRANASEPERKLIDRSIQLIKDGEVAYAERDQAKARPLQLKLLRDTIAFQEATAAFAPNDLDTIAAVINSIALAADTVESSGFTDELPPGAIRAKARALADKLTKAHPTNARAWSLLAGTTPYSDRLGRLRAWNTCMKLDPGCKPRFETERIDYERPYCEGAAIKPTSVEWREATKKPLAAYTKIEHHYEEWFLAPVAKFSNRDVIRIESGETHVTNDRADGTTTEEVMPDVTFVLGPDALTRFTTWTRELEKRDDGYALMVDGKLMFISQRAMWESNSPGISNSKIGELCASTKTRKLPPLD